MRAVVGKAPRGPSGEDMNLMVIGLADGKVVLLHGDLHRAK